MPAKDSEWLESMLDSTTDEFKSRHIQSQTRTIQISGFLRIFDITCHRPHIIRPEFIQPSRFMDQEKKCARDTFFPLTNRSLRHSHLPTISSSFSVHAIFTPHRKYHGLPRTSCCVCENKALPRLNPFLSNRTSSNSRHS
jgi:hypothetical protein